jgi:hypothetical protein
VFLSRFAVGAAATRSLGCLASKNVQKCLDFNSRLYRFRKQHEQAAALRRAQVCQCQRKRLNCSSVRALFFFRWAFWKKSGNGELEAGRQRSGTLNSHACQTRVGELVIHHPFPAAFLSWVGDWVQCTFNKSPPPLHEHAALRTMRN